MTLEFTEIVIERNGVRLECLSAGNPALLREPTWTGFLSSRKLPGDEFLDCIDWAKRFPIETSLLATACHSPVEQEVTRIVLERGGRAIIFLARSPIKKVPPDLRHWFDNKRLTFVIPKGWKNSRPTRKSCLERNLLIESVATDLTSHFGSGSK